jgi:hypothetical protein
MTLLTIILIIFAVLLFFLFRSGIHQMNILASEGQGKTVKNFRGHSGEHSHDSSNRRGKAMETEKVRRPKDDSRNSDRV